MGRIRKAIITMIADGLALAEHRKAEAARQTARATTIRTGTITTQPGTHK